MLAAGGLLLLAAVALLAAPLAVEHYIFSEYALLRKVTREQYMEWRTRRWMLPEAALRAEPFNPETRESVRQFHAAWDKLGKKAKELSDPDKPSSPDDPMLGNKLAGLEELTQAFEMVVQRPDYDIAAFFSDRDPESEPLYKITSCGRLLRMKAMFAAREGRTEEALKAAETCARASLAHRYDTLVLQLCGLLCCQYGREAWNEALRQCQDAILLRRALEAQNRLASQFDFLADRTLPIMILAEIGRLREFKRHGMQIEYQGLSEREMVGKIWAIHADYLEIHRLPELMKQDPAEAREIRKVIADYRSYAARNGAPGGGWRGMYYRYLGRIDEPADFVSSRVANSTARWNQVDEALDQFDCLRLETARKLYGLERGKAPSADTDLVPQYLPQLPQMRIKTNQNRMDSGGSFVGNSRQTSITLSTATTNTKEIQP